MKDLENNYEMRLRHLIKMSYDDMAKYKKMFSTLSSESGYHIIVYLMQSKLKGDRYVWRQTILEEMNASLKYGESRIAHNLAEMINAGIVEKKKVGKKDTLYGLTDTFQRLSKSMILLEQDLPSVTIKNRNKNGMD